MKKCINLFVKSMIISLLLILNQTVLINATSTNELGSWESKADMLTERDYFGAVEVDGKIYVIGGRGSDNQYLDTVDMYDTQLDKWTNKTTLENKRAYFSVAKLGGKIYLIGGINESGNVLNTIEEYNPETDIFTQKANMPTARQSLAVAVHDNKIYAIGGKSEDGTYLKTVEVYNPETDSWVEKSSMSVERHRLGAEVVNGKIYAVGGSNSINVQGSFKVQTLNTLEEYNPETDSWTTKKNLLSDRHLFGLAEANGRLYLIGGNTTGTSYVNTVEEYNPKTDSWTRKLNMRVGKNRFEAVEVNNKIYLFGGHISTGLLTEVEVFSPPIYQPELTAPLNLTAAVSGDQIKLNWDAVMGSESYVVLRSTTPDVINEVISSTITDNQYIDKNVEAGITYYYVIRAVKEGVESEDSNIASAMIEEVNNNFAVLQIKMSTTDIYEYRVTMDKVDDFISWYIDRSNEEDGNPFYRFPNMSNLEPYTDVNEYIIFDKIVWFKVKEYLER